MREKIFEIIFVVYLAGLAVSFSGWMGWIAGKICVEIIIFCVPERYIAAAVGYLRKILI